MDGEVSGMAIAERLYCAYSGPESELAMEMYQLYVTDSKNGYGRVAGESVTLMQDGEIVREQSESQISI